MQISLPSSGVSFTPHCPHVCPAFFWSSGEERLGCLNWDVTKALSAPVARRALERYGAAGSAVFEPLLRLCLSRSALSRPSAAQASLITSLITPILPPHATHPIFPTHISATAQPTHTHLTHTRRFFFFDASTQSGETRRSPSSAAPRPIIAHAVPSRRRRSPDARARWRARRPPEPASAVGQRPAALPPATVTTSASAPAPAPPDSPAAARPSSSRVAWSCPRRHSCQPGRSRAPTCHLQGWGSTCRASARLTTGRVAGHPCERVFNRVCGPSPRSSSLPWRRRIHRKRRVSAFLSNFPWQPLTREQSERGKT